MFNRKFLGLAVVATAAAVAVPGIATGNARRSAGTLSALRQAETPLLAQLTGVAETPTTGDPDGSGAAAVSFHRTSVTDVEVCWDLRYSAIAAPTAAHIHRGAAGVAGPIVVTFASPGPTTATGCAPVDSALATEIVTTPANFYVNVHNVEFPGGALRGQLALGAEPAGTEHLLPTPVRSYDSRVAGQTKLSPSAPRTVSLATGLDATGTRTIAVPPGATGALVTLTVTETGAGGGFLKLFKGDGTEPPTSVINWTTANDDVAVSTHVAVDATGSVKVVAGNAGTHFIVDVVGFFY
jgi:CHRD domain